MSVLKKLAEPPGIPLRAHVDLKIEVNQTHCKAPKNVAKLNDTWARTTIHAIVAHAAAHFQDAPVAGNAKPTTEVRMRQAWSRLCDFSPRAETHDGRRRLVITPGKNIDVRAEASQLLGVGIGLAVICAKLEVPYTSIVKQNFSSKVFHDFEGVRRSKPLKIEVRGRYRRNNRTKALDQVKKKFSGGHDFASAVAAQVYPFNVANRDHADIELVDPDGDVPDLSLDALCRQAIRHYLPYLERQNVHSAILLQMLVALPNDTFATFFRSTWRRVWQPILEGQPIPVLGRTSLHCAGERYWGTIYNDWAAPPWASQYVDRTQGGFVFMGLPLVLFRQFTTIEDTVRLLQYGPPVATANDGYVYVRLGDGFLLIWSPTLEGLTRHE
jgi:hypothetical protein